MGAPVHYGTRNLSSLLANFAHENIKIVDWNFGECNSRIPLSGSAFVKNQNPRASEEESRSSERRIVPRKAYAMLVRFNVIAQELVVVSARAKVACPAQPRNSRKRLCCHSKVKPSIDPTRMGFKTRQSLSVGDSVEIFFLLPTELTGRAMKDAQCNARVVHVDREADMSGRIGVGAAIECFERTSVARNWDD